MAASLQQEFCALRDTYIEKQFGRLNDMQRQAVFTTDGPLLILAGAGSGKTTVLVNRIANLIRFGSAHGSSWTPREVTEEDVKALKTAIMTGTDAPAWLDGMLRQNAVRSWNVMAITFTNKAAGELKERLRNMLGGEEGDEVFASTFHSACVRILRRWAESIGYPRSFTIYDTDDSQRVMKAVYKELSIDDKFFPIKSAINQMSRWKDQLVSPEEALRTPARDTKGAIAAKVYAAYEKKLKEAGAFDFDALIYQTVQLHGLVDQGVEVEGSCLLELFFVGGVDFGGNGSLGVPGWGAQRLLRADQLVLPAAHLVDGALDREELIVDAQFLIDRLHHALGVIGIIDGKAAGVADGFCPTAQDAHTGRVEGGGKHLVPLFAAQHIAQALLELPCRLIGKGDGHHVPTANSVLPQHPVQPGGRIGAGHNCRFQSLDILLCHLTGGPAGTVGRAKPDQVCDTVDQNSGLAAACTGQNEQRAVGGKYRLPLHIVQAAKLLFNIGIAQSAEFLLETCCHCFTCSSIKSLTL